MSDKNSLHLYLGEKRKKAWRAYCKKRNLKPGGVIKEGIDRQIKNATDAPDQTLSAQTFQPDTGKKQRFEVMLTPTEKTALKAISVEQNCSMRRWVIDAIRVGLTAQAQSSTEEIKHLASSNYQLGSIGRNLNQITKKLNEGKFEPVVTQDIEALNCLIQSHIETVSDTIAASIDRWKIKK